MAGGRYGLYFRESLKAPKARKGSLHHEIPTSTTYENYTDEIFIDTGVTYPSNVKKSNTQIDPPPLFPKKHTSQNALLLLGLSSIFIAFIGSFNAFYILGGILLTGSILLLIDNYKIERDKKATIQLLTELDRALQKDGNISNIINSETLRKLKQDYRNVFNYQMMVAVLNKYIDRLDSKLKERILKLKEYIKMTDQTFRSVKIRTFVTLFDEYMRDHLLEEEEEKILRNFSTNLELIDSDIQDELSSIELMSQIRKEINSDLSPIPTNIKLQKSEKCFYSSEARLLKKKILKTQTIQGVKYKHVGYVIEKEGRVHLTDERILMLAEGTSTTKLEKILDVTVIPEANIVEMVVDGRKSPMIFTLPSAVVFGTKIEKIKEEFHAN